LSTQPFTIATDGDLEEQHYWPLFVRQHFPSYETFWVKRVVPLTRRVDHRSAIGFRMTFELKKDGFDDEDVAVAQLHYTLLMHLGRVFDQLSAAQAFVRPAPLPHRTFDRHAFFECFTRLSGASDVADELLGRRASPGVYDAWSEKHGSDARTAWRKTHPDPLRPIRAYRNRLVHGRVVPELWGTMQSQTSQHSGSILTYPRIDKVNDYLDWREAFAIRAVPGPGSAVVSTAPPPDFEEAALIVRQVWQEVVSYVETSWQTHLLPSI
jgi:hypothetical protein